MNGIQNLLTKLWIWKDADKSLFYQVKHELPEFTPLIREKLGWRLIQTENLIKLEKTPGHALPFMGITEFTEVRDYCILCGLLIFLEDKKAGEQFLLSEVIPYITVYLKETIGVDWTSFSQRKSLVRALQYVRSMDMVREFDGSSEALSQGIEAEALYENTGISRYFAANFPYDLSSITSWEDFEAGASDASTGTHRINRVYRQMVACPAMYWQQNEDPDSLYLRNQRRSVTKNMETLLGGRLDLHKNAAFWMLTDADGCGLTHPREAMLPELALMMGSYIRQQVERGIWQPDGADCICVGDDDFRALFLKFRREYLDAWSKEYREMECSKAYSTVKDYMQRWLMVQQQGDKIIIYPGAVKCTGFYPADYCQTRGERDEQSLENEPDGVRELLAVR